MVAAVGPGHLPELAQLACVPPGGELPWLDRWFRSDYVRVATEVRRLRVSGRGGIAGGHLPTLHQRAGHLVHRSRQCASTPEGGLHWYCSAAGRSSILPSSRYGTGVHMPTWCCMAGPPLGKCRCCMSPAHSQQQLQRLEARRLCQSHPRRRCPHHPVHPRRLAHSPPRAC